MTSFDTVVSRFYHREKGIQIAVSYKELLEMFEHLDLGDLSPDKKEELEECLKRKLAGNYKIIQIVGNQQIAAVAKTQINLDREALGNILESLAALLKEDGESAELLKELLKAILKLAS